MIQDQGELVEVWKRRRNPPSSDIAIQAYRLLARASSFTDMFFVILIRAMVWVSLCEMFNRVARIGSCSPLVDVGQIGLLVCHDNAQAIVCDGCRDMWGRGKVGRKEGSQKGKKKEITLGVNGFE